MTWYYYTTTNAKLAYQSSLLSNGRGLYRNAEVIPHKSMYLLRVLNGVLSLDGVAVVGDFQSYFQGPQRFRFRGANGLPTRKLPVEI